MNKLCGHIVYIALGAVLGLGVSFLFRKVLLEPVPRRFHMEARINWINGITAEVAHQISPSLPGSQIEGLWGVVDGSVDALLMAERIRSKEIEDVALVDKELGKEVTLDIEFPTDFSIQRLDVQQPSPVFISIEAEHEYMSYVGYPEEIDESKEYPDHPRPLDQSILPFRFHIGKERRFRVSFVQKEVAESGPFAIPREFTVDSPMAIEFSSPTDRLPESQARTAVFSCEKLPLDDESNTTGDILVYSRKLSAHFSNCRLRLGNMSREGEHSILIGKMSHTTPIELNSWIANPFLFAVSPQYSDEKKSWLTLKGSLSYFLTKQVDGTISLGKVKEKLTSTDQVEIIGNSMVGLIFEPGSLPELKVDGIAEYVFLNGEQLLPSRWASINANVRGGLVGGIIGFLASFITLFVGKKRISFGKGESDV